jgi:hypothetical protein
MGKLTQKPNLLVQYAKNKFEAQIQGKGKALPMDSASSRFPRPVNSRPLAKRGGRNGQGKPS